MADKPHAEIRSQLLKVRRANRSRSMKEAAETWIAAIDQLAKTPDDDDAFRVFHEGYREFYRIAEAAPRPALMSPAEIAKAFGLVGTSQ